MAKKDSSSTLDLFSNIEQDLGFKPKQDMSIEAFAEACKKNLYPGQLLLLKLIFLQDLSQEEEDRLDYWIAGGAGGGEIVISPKIRERIAWLKLHGYEHFREVVLVGGRRSGKGHITGVAFAYKMYKLLGVDVMKEYGIDPDKSIYFSAIAVSQDQAKAHQYADFSSTVAACPELQDHIWKINELEFSVMTDYDKIRMKALEEKLGRKVGRDISKLRGVALAANANSVRGSATMCAVLDEVAKMQQEGDSYMTAANVYKALSPSLLGFGKNSLCMLNSSPHTKIGKFYEKYVEAIRLEDNGVPVNHTIFTLQFPSWSVFSPDPHLPKAKRRPALMASPDWDADAKDNFGEDLYSEEDKAMIEIARIEEQADPDKFKVESRARWAEVLDAFLRPEMVDRAFLGRPLGNDQFELMKTNWNKPVANVDYYCHLDPSSTTAGFGFIMAHAETFQEVDPKTKEPRYEDHCAIDLIKRWRPQDFQSQGYGADMVFDYEWVLEEISNWISIFRPVEISTDQFGAGPIIAWLNRWSRENDAQIRIVEQTATLQSNYRMAMRFRDAVYLERVHFPADTADCDWLGLELKNLQQINSQGAYGRIDCPSSGPVTTKDLYVCAASLVYSLIGDTTTQSVREALANVNKPVLGLEGGYRIGGLPRRSLESLRQSMGQSADPASQRQPHLGSQIENYGHWAKPRRFR